ncbi:hypothetical protein D3C85_1492830 [compost metagenome]
MYDGVPMAAGVADPNPKSPTFRILPNVESTTDVVSVPSAADPSPSVTRMAGASISSINVLANDDRIVVAATSVFVK